MSVGRYVPFFAIAVMISFSAFFFLDRSMKPAVSDPGLEEIAVFNVENYGELLPMQEVPPGSIIPNGTRPIHDAHVTGTLHAGVWIHVLNRDGQLLFLRRTNALRTCPGAWGLLGEHAHANERPVDLAARGLQEEAGLDHGQVSLSLNMTRGPLLYHREYDDGRVDRQLTWLWVVVLEATADARRLRFDDEVAEHAWKSVEEAQEWMERSPADFCHSSIAALLSKGLLILQQCSPQPRTSHAELARCLAQAPQP